MPAPAGPYICVPAEFLRDGFGASGIAYVCHSTVPVAASIATRLPRNVQHSYLGLFAETSSRDATGTYRRPRYSTGAPVIRAIGCCSTFVFQSCLPVAISTAKTFALSSPKYAVEPP